MFLGRHHKKEKRFGPGPTNNYTAGSGRKFWQRKNRKSELRDPEVATVPATTAATTNHAALAPGAHHDYRPSHDTHMTGSTAYGGAPHVADGPLDKTTYNAPVTGGYHTAPTGTYATPATNY